MIVTLAYLRRQFDEFNKLVFDGRLPVPRLKVSNSRSMLGCVRYKSKKPLFGKRKFFDFSLSISAFYDLDEEVLDDTIIHEMIHLDILSNHMIDDSAHGPLFRQKMDEINARFGRHITISHRGQLDMAPKNRPVQNILAVSQLEDGSWGITRASQSKVFELYRDLPRFFSLRETRWYHSRNPYFSSLPRSLKPKIYRITKEVLDKELQGAIPLEFCISGDGKKLIIRQLQQQQQQ